MFIAQKTFVQDLYKVFNNYPFTYNSLILSFFSIWIIEWNYILNNCFLIKTFSFYFFPYKIPILLLFSFFYFIYIWIISVWRRTLYGRFTRGDRKLWYKGYASFWIFELLTIIGIFSVACWMNWGPGPIVPRKFYVNKKWFLEEVTLFSYIIWVTYLSKFNLKWKKWNLQYFTSFLALFFISLLLWRDLLIIFGRETISLKNGSNWKNITRSTICYSVVPNWWLRHFINTKNNSDLLSNFYSLHDHILSLKLRELKSPFNKNDILIKYKKYNFLPYYSLESWLNNSLPYYNFLFLNFKFYHNWTSSFYKNENYKLNNYYITNFLISSPFDSFIYYPRKIGYKSKRISIWTLLIYLKIWHHLMILFGWLFFLLKIINKKKASYPLLSVCSFNLYCCFLISFIIFMYSYVYLYESIFRFFKKKHTMIGVFRKYGWFWYSVTYPYNLFYNSIKNFKNIFYSNNTDIINNISKVSILNYDTKASYFRIVDKSE